MSNTTKRMWDKDQILSCTNYGTLYVIAKKTTIGDCTKFGVFRLRKCKDEIHRDLGLKWMAFPQAESVITAKIGHLIYLNTHEKNCTFITQGE